MLAYNLSRNILAIISKIKVTITKQDYLFVYAPNMFDVPIVIFS